MLTSFVDWLATLGTGAVLISTFLSTAVEMTFLLGLLVPGEAVVMLASSRPAGPAGFALVVAVGTAGALTGQILGYAVGRLLGTRLRGTRLGRLIGAERFDRAETYLRDHGAPALVAVRFVAVIHAVVPIVAGTARMPFGRFLGWAALGTVLWVGTFAGVGAATAGADSTGGVAVVLTAIGATCLGAVPLAARLLRRPIAARLLRRARAGRPLPGPRAGRPLRRPLAGRPLAGRPLAGRPLAGRLLRRPLAVRRVGHPLGARLVRRHSVARLVHGPAVVRFVRRPVWSGSRPRPAASDVLRGLPVNEGVLLPAAGSGGSRGF